jgi:hypothetical protein
MHKVGYVNLTRGDKTILYIESCLINSSLHFFSNVYRFPLREFIKIYRGNSVFPLLVACFFELTHAEIEKATRVIRGGDDEKIFINLFHSSDQPEKIVIDEGEGEFVVR